VACWIGIDQEPGRRIVRVAGRLRGEQVPDLLEACAGGRSLEVNLSDIQSVDAIGIEALQRIRAAGAKLVSVPTYIQMKIDSSSEGTTDIRPPVKP